MGKKAQSKAQEGLPEAPGTVLEGTQTIPEVGSRAEDVNSRTFSSINASPEAFPAVLTLKEDVSSEDIEALRKAIDKDPPVILVPERPEMPPEDIIAEDLPPDMDVRDAIKAVICVKKGKRDVPTLVGYHSRLSKADRQVIIDVNRNLLADAWAVYVSKSADPDPEVFLATVMDILKHDFPRIYRTVATLTLE